MYQKNDQGPKLSLFPINILNPKDMWVLLAEEVPWFEIELLLCETYKENGRLALPVRLILGAMIIQTYLGLSDRDTTEMIQRTPSFQYFVGMSVFDPISEPFDFSLLCKYRQRLGIELAQEMIYKLLAHHKVGMKIETKKSHAGSLSIDATVVPVNITYPTDLKLLNKVREKTEEIIDECHLRSEEKEKPRTYRVKARADYLQYAKAKKLSKEKRFTGNRKQLQYIKRNLETLKSKEEDGQYELTTKEKETLQICETIYEQQYEMWTEKTNRVEDRIVNLAQPHIRGIVRGKAGAKIEFGAKLAMSKVNGYIEIDKLSFDNFNEGQTLKEILEHYKEKYGCYPESVRADQIYQTRDNKMYCKEIGVRLSGKPLGRPKKEAEPDEVMKNDMRKRIEIESVFGIAKTKYGMDNLMTKLPETQQASIGLIVFVMNLIMIHRKVSFSPSLSMEIFSIITNEDEFIFD